MDKLSRGKHIQRPLRVQMSIYANTMQSSYCVPIVFFSFQVNLNGFSAQWKTARFKKLTAMDLITPIITVIVAITLQFPWDADPAGTQETLLSST